MPLENSWKRRFCDSINFKMSLYASALKNLCLWCEFQSHIIIIIISLLLNNFLTALLYIIFFSNRPFPSSKKFHFQNEAKCETFVVEMSFICIIIKTHFHNKGFAISLVLKVKLFGTRKWPIL